MEHSAHHKLNNKLPDPQLIVSFAQQTHTVWNTEQIAFSKSCKDYDCVIRMQIGVVAMYLHFVLSCIKNSVIFLCE